MAYVGRVVWRRRRPDGETGRAMDDGARTGSTGRPSPEPRACAERASGGALPSAACVAYGLGNASETIP